ncbi:uncharacterized protein LOC101897060 isoform X2 [Musca domestica]|uniref:Uncharacterized protein LOC101897060 isoform X2 n=1 Tax=Musca domestica TaxID=7370 RepID=A0A1I8N479_MUSDO|nr:uncharacterized protein LOC101897060 isoform X2 [Musca domestica]
MKIASRRRHSAVMKMQLRNPFTGNNSKYYDYDDSDEDDGYIGTMGMSTSSQLKINNTKTTDLLITLNNKTLVVTTPLNGIRYESAADDPRSTQASSTTKRNDYTEHGVTTISNYYGTTLWKKNITEITSTTSKPRSTTKTTTTIKSEKLLTPHNSTDVQTQRKFYINTSRCHMPYVDPFTPAIKKLFRPSLKTGCTKDEPIISVKFDNKNKVYKLQTNYTVAQKFIKKATVETIVDDLRCCYRQIERSGSGSSADSKYKLLPCTLFHQNFTVPKHVNGIIVDCSSKSLNKVIQQDAFTFIQVNKNRTETFSKKDAPKVGIIMFGIDSLSRMNFRRTMPKTFKYLVDKGWYELKGYNKVADNTYPNLMPVLVGYANGNAIELCKPKTPGGLDNCTFIWNHFRDYGFPTGYAEDTSSISTFNYLKKGFMKPPTDHYFRPTGMAIEKNMKIVRKAAENYCIGRRQYGEYIYDFGVEFAKRYRNQTHFGLFWTNSFSHNSYDTTASMDSRMLEYFEELEREGIMETSFVFFFSDHGRRWGPLLKLPEGFLEERLPMFFISTPKWFKERYPELSRNLEVNQRRLSSNFDVHMTLQHLLELATLNEYKSIETLDCTSAQSLFYEIPEERDCHAACVPETWCTCLPYITQPTTDALVKNVTSLILAEMNKWLVARNLSSLCSELSLNGISSAFLRDHDPAMLSSSSASPDMATYRIEFTTKPKTSPTTQFSATVDYDIKNRRISLNVEDIGRHSKYEKTAKCVDDKQAKKYCICKNSLT